MKRNQKLGKKGQIKQNNLDHISNSTEIPDPSIVENIFILKTVGYQNYMEPKYHFLGIAIVKLKISNNSFSDTRA